MKFVALLAMGGLATFLPAHSAVADPRLWLSTTLENGELVLTWPGWATDGVLEETSDIQSPAVWTQVAPGPYVTDFSSLNYSFRVIPTFSPEENRFYRVRRVNPPVPGMTAHWEFAGGNTQTVADQSQLGNTLWTTNTSWTTDTSGFSSLGFNGLPIDASGS